ncbi:MULTISPECIES: TIGR02611 family protein [Actinoplanes]|uniref:TIGR02611 family protein n=2 Tax=Actinoplanes TaxID=1865 RepID=A0A101JT19_9ACTN|nr:MULTISPECIES: TIGR02611 family protein [Actinoplanes]KUL32593.1 hypothetical protein ADL15_18905 [Actinoplanes awajinensis subsp. mycoplanecinus]GIE70088.1 TIGR02611 family protein [Actinoplanes palleronii]
MGVKPDDEATGVRLLDRIRSNPSGRLALKIGIGVLGTLVVAVGIVLIPFPGPGWAIVILGLAILALEFAWAKSLLEFTKRHVLSWTHWIGRQSWPMRGLIGVLGMIFVTAVVWGALRLSLGIDLIQVAQDWLAQR